MLHLLEQHVDGVPSLRGPGRLAGCLPAQGRKRMIGPIADQQMQVVIETLNEASTTARELRDLVTSVDEMLAAPEGDGRVSEIQRVLATAEATGARLINRSFILLAVLVATIIGASILRGLVRRRAASSADG